MSALTPPNDGFDLYLATIADNDSDFDEEADDICEDCGEFRDACACLDAELEDDDDAVPAVPAVSDFEPEGQTWETCATCGEFIEACSCAAFVPYDPNNIDAGNETYRQTR